MLERVVLTEEVAFVHHVSQTVGYVYHISVPKTLCPVFIAMYIIRIVALLPLYSQALLLLSLIKYLESVMDIPRGKVLPQVKSPP